MLEACGQLLFLGRIAHHCILVAAIRKSMSYYVGGVVLGHLHRNVVIVVASEVLAFNRLCKLLVLEHLQALVQLNLLVDRIVAKTLIVFEAIRAEDAQRVPPGRRFIPS